MNRIGEWFIGIFKRESKDIAELDKALTDMVPTSEEHSEQKELVIRKIIDGKLYDTSKAEKICSVVVPEREIPKCKLYFCTLGGQKVTIYKGNTEFFIVYLSCLQPVDEEWVRNWIGKQDIDKYIELFGEPELA